MHHLILVNFATSLFRRRRDVVLVLTAKTKKEGCEPLVAQRVRKLLWQHTSHTRFRLDIKVFPCRRRPTCNWRELVVAVSCGRCLLAVSLSLGRQLWSWCEISGSCGRCLLAPGWNNIINVLLTLNTSVSECKKHHTGHSQNSCALYVTLQKVWNTTSKDFRGL